MRGNNKRKLVSEDLLQVLLHNYTAGVPLAKLIANYELRISPPHLKKLLFIYIRILDEVVASDTTSSLRSAMFPPWLKDGVHYQPDAWNFTGTFPNGQWGVKN